MEALTVKVFAITNGKEGISPDDYKKNKNKTVILNTVNVCYITEPEEFRTAFSNELIGEISVIIMNNGDNLYLKRESYEEFVKIYKI